MDAFLDELGKAIDANDEVVLPPLGKLMVKNRADRGGGTVLTVKLKRTGASKSDGSSPLAQDDAES